MLTIIKSLVEYEALYNKYVIQKKTRGYTNFFVNKSSLITYINNNKIKYDIIADTLFLFVDQGTYYKMYFWGLDSNLKSIPNADKNICCDIYEQQMDDIHTAFVHQLFIKNNFKLEQCYEQVRLSYGNLYKKACQYLEENIGRLKDYNMRLGVVNLNDKNQVENLILENMGKYDGLLSVEDDYWEDQILNDNVVGIYIFDKLIAVYYFTEKASRIIVDKSYRGKNLSVLLRMYFATQSRWKNSSKNQYGWAESDNIPSKITFRKLFAVYTGKVKYRYVRI